MTPANAPHPAGRRPRPRRILYVEVCEDGTIGGSHQALFDLARTLDRDRFEPVVLFYQNNRFIDSLRALGIEALSYQEERIAEREPHLVHDVPGKVMSIALAPLRRARLLKKHRIDLVHLNNSPADGCEDWLPASRLVRVPCMAQAAGTFLLPRRAVGRWLARRHDRVIAASRYVEGTLRDGGVPSERIRVIAPGVDIARFRSRVHRSRAEMRQLLGVPPDAVLIVMIGNIRWLKGQDILLEALRQLTCEELARAHVVFAGDTGPRDADYAASVQELARTEPRLAMVQFLGARTDVPELLNAGDIAVQASRVPEAFGLVVVEAMALGMPVIASRLGGPSEIVTAESGIIFDPGNASELASALRRLLGDAELRTRIGASARARAGQFDIAPSVQETQLVYDDLLTNAH